ncbi:MAG: prolyl oligopeptidase family serine peptidase [Mariniphaga sp.]|nr:prolyl oligopeptidase family serine peptidase [Mariniphaga sp.]
MKDYFKYIIIITAVIILSAPTISAQQTEEKFEGNVSFSYKYLLYLPDGYEIDNEKEYPFLLFLHGGGEKGENLNRVKVNGPPKFLENKKDFPFIVVSPQCPGDERWTAYKLNALIEGLVEKYRIDKERIYLTGLSMGGYGTWDLASNYPHWFAAIAPICGGGDVRRVRALKDIPVWTFHGMRDNVIPIERSLELVRALEKIDGNIKFTVYPEANHNSWTKTYNNPELWEWFLKHKRVDTE